MISLTTNLPSTLNPGIMECGIKTPQSHSLYCKTMESLKESALGKQNRHIVPHAHLQWQATSLLYCDFKPRPLHFYCYQCEVQCVWFDSQVSKSNQLWLQPSTDTSTSAMTTTILRARMWSRSTQGKVFRYSPDTGHV